MADEITDPVENEGTPAEGEVPPTEGEAPPAPAPAPAEEPAPEPIEYDFAAGENSLIDDGYIGEFKTVAEEMKLTNEQAQQLVTMQDTFVGKLQQQATDQWGEQVKAWEAEVKADPDLGGDNWTTTDQHIKKALDAFGSESLTKALNDTGYGNHPDLVRFVAAVGKSLNEDTPVGGNDNAGGGKSLADALYGNSN